MYLFFDTETTGLPLDYKAHAENLDNWPRIVSISWLLQRSATETIASGDYVIKPEGWTILENVSAIHGITTERALEIGIPLSSALGEFHMSIEKSETLVAHDLSFDFKIAAAEFLRLSLPAVVQSMASKKQICTKLSSVHVCKLPGKFGYKWPRLRELHLHLFGHEFEDQHTSFADVMACARCFWELKKRGVING